MEMDKRIGGCKGHAFSERLVACDFSKGLACVKDVIGKRSFIDKDGKVMIPYQWILILSLSFIQFVTVCAQSIGDTNCNYEFVDKNDSTMELRVSINGHEGKAEYCKANNGDDAPLPTFQGRYKDCMVFMLGYGQHYRLLTVFQVINGTIVREDYEHTMCLEPDKKESYLFFHDGQPVRMTYDYQKSKVKFKKLRNGNKYYKFKGKTIISCKNKFHVD